MITVGLSVIKKLVEDNNLDNYYLVFNEIDRLYFRKDERPAVDFLRDYISRYRSIPDLDLMIIETGIEDLREEIPSAPYGYWVDTIKQRRLGHRVSKNIASLSAQISDNDWTAAKDTVTALFSLVNEKTGGIRARTLLDLSPDVIDAHDDIQSGRKPIGIPIGIPYIDNTTGGVYPGDNWVLVAKTEVGKTYLALKFALGAAEAGYKVLLVSMEMPELQIATRALALESYINAQRLRLGRVSYFGMRNLLNHIGRLDRTGIGERIIILPGEIKLNVEAIEQKIQEERPHLVLIDGAYMVKSGTIYKGTAGWEQRQLIIEAFKALALTYKVGIIGTYQYDQKISGNNISLGHIMGGQAISHAASIVLYLEIDEDEDEGFSLSTNRILTSLKGREGESFRLRLRYALDRGSIEVIDVLSSESDLVGSGIDDPFSVD